MRWAVMWIVMVGCGPSTAEMRTAAATHYRLESQAILKIAEDVAQETYKLGDVNDERRMFITAPRFYSREGDLESPGAEGFVRMHNGSVEVSFIVSVVEVDEHSCVVNVVPKTFEVVGGSPKPRELGPDDPYLPPWVLGRRDALAYAIYERAKAYALP